MRKLILLMALSFHPLFALVECPIDEKQPIGVIFSRSSHNRISVQDGAVEKVYGNGAHFDITIDPLTGNAFIHVLRDLSDPTTLTVVTHGGFIQDVVVSSENKPSEHLILREIDEIDDLVSSTPQLHAPSVELLNKILEGKIPRGYGQRLLQDTDRLSLPAPLTTTPIEAFEGPYEQIVVYKIRNGAKQGVVISSDAIKKEPMLWVFLNGHELRAKEEVVCIVSFPKEEK